MMIDNAGKRGDIVLRVQLARLAWHDAVREYNAGRITQDELRAARFAADEAEDAMYAFDEKILSGTIEPIEVAQLMK